MTTTGGGRNRVVFRILFSSQKFSFTLAEVLITLVIIGVIAAITVSSLIANTQKQEYISRLKKADSVLRQALYKVAIDSGYPVGDFSFVSDYEFFDVLKKHLNTIKVCTKSGQDCFPSGTKTLKGQFHSDYNNIVSYYTPAFVTADGIAFNFQCYGSEKYSFQNKGISEEDIENALCRIMIDVNGQSSPNTFGRDSFFLIIVNGKGVVAAGSGNDSADCSKNDKGFTCAARVLKTGKMDY